MPLFSQATLWFNRHGLREIDRRCATQFHLPVTALMENAGTGVAHIVTRYTTPCESILVLCGAGNNGGDSLVAARHLANRGYQLHVMLTSPSQKFQPAAAGQLATIAAMDIPITDISSGDAPLARWLAATGESACIVDGMFGTGLSRPLRGSLLALVAAVNAAERLVISVDIPSGLDCDTGEPLGLAIRAGHTVTFCGMKIGFAQPAAATYTGQLSIADIGAPAALLRELAIPTPD